MDHASLRPTSSPSHPFPLRITPIPCLEDNYAWLLHCPTTGHHAVVDPSECGPVLKALAGHTLDAIFLTHHHWDHVGGIPELLEAFPGIPVYAHASDQGRITGQTVGLETGDTVAFGAHTAHITHIPGHTLGAIAWYFPEAHSGETPGVTSEGAVFTGDTLFLGGCGRLFEGTPAQMHHSLQYLAGLPETTRVYVGHEYSVSNLKFSLWLDPAHQPTQALLAHYLSQREGGHPTPPGSVGTERQTNPFLRVTDQAFRHAIWAKVPEEPTGDAHTAALEAFTLARKLKDTYRG